MKVNNKTITSKDKINMLGVTCDSKLQWSNQVAQAVNKSKKALHAIRLIRKYLTKNETKQLLTSNYYSILYYNSEIWHMPSLNPRSKQQLLAASSNALKILNNQSDLMISYEQLHKMHKRAAPTQMMKYRLSIQLYKICNGYRLNDD